jgi:hypothetical protein
MVGLLQACRQSLMFLLQIIQIKAKVSFHQENGEERSNDLAKCCIENDILDTIDLDTVLSNFASREKPKEVSFHNGSLILFGILR